ncbi:MAG: Mur ligase domain-containing protein [Oscillospiraceae bacterium]
MAPLAEVLAGMGLVIDGSDMAESDKTRYLRSLGIDIKIGHSAMNVAPDISSSSTPPRCMTTTPR